MNPAEFLTAWLITLVLEVPVLILLLQQHAPLQKLMFASICASSLTLPWIWFVADYWWTYRQVLTFGEPLVVGMEASLVSSWLSSKIKTILPAVLIANLTSLTLGFWIIS